MSFTVTVDDTFAGCPLEDLLPVLGELPQPIEVRWECSPADLYAYEQNNDKSFHFIVKDSKTLDRTLWALGGSVPMTAEDIAATKKALTSRATQEWRSTIEGMGATRGLLVMTRVLADSLRGGKRPLAVSRATSDCIHHGVHPQDVDLLMRLRTSR